MTPGRNASTGAFVSLCGLNENGHRNPDNFIVAPGVSNGAHHVHDYVGNKSTDGFSTDRSLAPAGTTCKGDDRSAYFWPVLRYRTKAGDDADEPGGGKDGNIGTILRPASVQLEFRGNARDKVRAMPRFLRVITGDAKAGTNGPANARASWTCTGFEDRTTTKYPVCPQGSSVVRTLDFASCWDGKNTDSANHRAHIVFPKGDGSCWQKTVAVPQLRMTLTYDVPPRSVISVDAFPEQKHNPITDHADFTNVMPDRLMRLAVDCINGGRRCDAGGPVGNDPGTGTAEPSATPSRAIRPSDPTPTGRAGATRSKGAVTATGAPGDGPPAQRAEAPTLPLTGNTATAPTGNTATAPTGNTAAGAAGIGGEPGKAGDGSDSGAAAADTATGGSKDGNKNGNADAHRDHGVEGSTTGSPETTGETAAGGPAQLTAQPPTAVNRTSLPTTGNRTGLYAGIGVLLTLVGALLVVLRRRSWQYQED